MTRLRAATLVAIAALVALPAAALAAQDFADLCRQHRTFKAGQWAAYESSGGRADSGTMRFAIVGIEGTGTGARALYEMSFGRRHKGKTETTIMQMLVSGLGTTAVQVHSLVMKAGDHPAMKYPDAMIGMANRFITTNMAQEIAKNCATAQVVGWESVTVPAGTFRALHIRNEDGGEAWVAPEVPFGMVRVKAKNGMTMVLTGRGNDARTSITETPQDMMGGRRP